MLVSASAADGDDAVVRARGGLPLRQHLGLCVKRVAAEHRRRKLDLLPAEIGLCFLRGVGDAHADDDGHRQRACDDEPAELGLARIFRVEVQRMRVHRQQREPGVVGLRDRPAGAMLVDITRREVLVVATEALPKALRADLPRSFPHRLLRPFLLYGQLGVSLQLVSMTFSWNATFIAVWIDQSHKFVRSVTGHLGL